MKHRLLIPLIVAFIFLADAGAIIAHHSGANYDREHLITLSGTVTEFDFTNPHGQIHFDVEDEQGNVVKWIAVGDPPQRLFKRGWTKTTFKPGDQITITGGPRRDGTKEIDMRNDQIVINGKKFVAKPE